MASRTRHFSVSIRDQAGRLQMITIWAVRIQRVPEHPELLRFLATKNNNPALAALELNPGVSVREFVNGQLIPVAELA